VDETMSLKSNDEGTVFSYTTHSRVIMSADPVSLPITPSQQQIPPASSKTAMVSGMESVKKRLFSSFSFSSNPTDEYDKKVFVFLCFALFLHFLFRFLVNMILAVSMIYSVGMWKKKGK
jgi:hypothetical protein